MTLGDQGDGPGSRSSRRDAARRKAQQHRVRQQRRARGLRVGLQIGIIVVVVAAVAGVVYGLTAGANTANGGPANMPNGGIVIGADYKAVRAPGAPKGHKPGAVRTTSSTPVPLITTYEDFMCSACGAFEKTNSAQIAQLVKSGQARLQIIPVAILDRLSSGTDYSTRAANAAACVANSHPDAFFAFHRLLYAHQPPENSAGLTDQQLIHDATESGAPGLRSCITSQRYKTWIGEVTDRWSKDWSATPTILVNGQPYAGISADRKSYDNSITDPTTFANFVLKAGAEFTASPTPTATPTSTPTPTQSAKK